MDEQTVKCPICGKPYKTYSYYSGDQSACRQCQLEARRINVPGSSWPLHRNDWPQNSINKELAQLSANSDYTAVLENKLCDLHEKGIIDTTEDSFIGVAEHLNAALQKRHCA
jgi:hypothetical protein